MAFLKVVKGSCPGQILELIDERTVIGRHPQCQIVLDNAAVSRHHAQILESHGNYYLEDLRSRNGTQLNGDSIEGRTELFHADSIQVCDVVFSFHLKTSTGVTSPRSEDGRESDGRTATESWLMPNSGDSSSIGVGEELIDSIQDTSSIITTLNAGPSSNLRIDIKPEAKLRAILEISSALGRTLQLDAVLPKILEGLFNIFPQADEGFILLKDPVKKKLVVKATRARHAPEDGNVRVSMTIVRRALETGEAILSADALQDQRFRKSDSLSNLRIRSMMCAPLIGHEGEPLGVLQVDTMNLGQQFSPEDLEVLASVASQAGLAVENASLHEEVLKQREMQRELEFATQVQLGFLPNERPKVPGYEFSDYYEAAQSVGGDYFDYVPLPRNRIAIAIADVAGKGVPAALLMARLYSSARYHLLTQSSVSAAMTGLNAEISSCGLGYRFITCVLAVLNPTSHQMKIANAGHLPPLLRIGAGEVTQHAVNEAGLPLGVVPDQQFKEVKVGLKAGETCLFYTDGVTEAMNDQNEIYGRHRLMELMREGAPGIDDLMKGIVADVEQFCGGRAQRDDTCLVGLQRIE